MLMFALQTHTVTQKTITHSYIQNQRTQLCTKQSHSYAQKQSHTATHKKTHLRKKDTYTHTTHTQMHTNATILCLLLQITNFLNGTILVELSLTLAFKLVWLWYVLA